MSVTRDPWQITREMFLSNAEVDSLLRRLQERSVAAQPAEQGAAALDDLLIRILVFSGLRNSECCRLRLADTVLGTGRSVLLVCGTPREDRTVFVPDELSDRIREYAGAGRRAASGFSAKDLSQPLIVNERGRPYERTGLYRRVVRILTEAGLGDRASVQLLRHTYGYLAYARTGGNLLFVQRQMGHAHPMVTSIYSQFVDESYEDLANKVASEPGPALLPKRVRRK